jgi:hypothetical protein
MVGGLFRDQRAIDFDMKRFGLVPKTAVGMNYSLLGSPVFQRVLDVQEAICASRPTTARGGLMTIEKTHIGIVITKTDRNVKLRDGKYVGGGKNEFYHKDTGRRHFAENTPSAFAGND